MEEQNFDIVAAVKQLVEDYGHLANEIAEVKASIYDNLINPIKADFEQMQHDNALSDFRCKYAEKLEPFSDKLKKLEKDDDFDVVEKAFDDFSARTDGMEEAEFVDKFVNKIQSQLDDIAAVFGVEPEKIEEIKVETEEGEVKAEVEDGEVVAVEGEGDATEESTEEAVEETAEEPEATEEVAEETPEAEAEPEVEEEAEADETVEAEPEEETTAKKIHKMLGIED